MTTPSDGTNLVANSWYDVTYKCVTSTCPRYNQINELGQCWSNGGNITNAIYCAPCSSFCEIVTADYIDPQPTPA